MRHAWIISFVAVACLAFLERAVSQTRQITSASIQGRVVQWNGNDRLSKATVELRGGLEPLKTTTDADGRYYFPNLPAGTYRLAARRDGYVPAEYGQQWLNGPGQPIPLANGQKLEDLDIPMLAAATISGRVTDSTGAPAVNVQVSALRVTYRGTQRLLRTVQDARTNQNGEYRLFWMPPGRYYIAAVPSGWAMNGMMMVNMDQADSSGVAGPYSLFSGQPRVVLGENAASTSGTLSPVFFPAETSVDFAMPIDAPSGEEYRGADIRLVPVPTYHVCGTVSAPGNIRPPANPTRNTTRSDEVPFAMRDAIGAYLAELQGRPPQPEICPGGGGAPLPPQARGSVRLVIAGTQAIMANASDGSYTTNIDPNTGRFAFRDVMPGAYELSTMAQGTPDTPALNGRTTVEVRGDVEGVSLSLEQGFDLKVRIVMETPPSGKPLQIGNLLRPYLGDDPTSPREPFLGGFTQNETVIRNVPRDDYRVYLQPLITSVVAPTVTRDAALENAYVKSITYGGRDSLNSPLRFDADPDATLDIVIGANPGSLEGRVRTKEGRPAIGAVVTLLPRTPGIRVFRTDMHRVVNTDRNGRFEAKGIPPGDYKVFAWAGIERDGWMDPALQKAHEESGVSVRIDEGMNGSIEVPLILPYAAQ